MFDIGFGELLLIAVVALFVIGPERLPGAAAQAGRMVRELRAMASGARRELSQHLDPELASLDLKSLNPREFVRSTLLDDEDDPERMPADRDGGRSVPRAPQRPVAEGERPPYDPDAT